MLERIEAGAMPLECLAHWVAQKGDQTYFVQPMGGGQVQELSWNQVNDQARRMAAYLKAQDLPPKSQIGILSKNCAWWIIADLAIWMAGHVSVPLYPNLNADTVAYTLEHSETKMLFLGKLDDWPSMQPGVPEDMPMIAFPLRPDGDFVDWDDILTKHEPLAEIAVRDPDEMATIVYTSGSTGRPKGVMLSFRAMQAAPQHGRGIAEQEPTDRVLSYLPLAHVMERGLLEQASLFNGLTVYFAESLDTFAEDLRRARPTLFASVPRLWVKFQLAVYEKMPKKKQDILFKIPFLNTIVKRKILEQLGLDQVRYALTGSAPLPATVVDWYRSLGLELLDGYGMSENFGYSHCTHPGKGRLGYVGPPSPGMEHKIADNGEILVRGATNMMGYYKAPEKTAETMDDDGWIYTGDMGEIDEQNRLKITGRVKELFKTSKGKYVAPAPIENKLCNHPAIEVVCVSGPNQPQPYALILLSDETRGHLAEAGVRDTLTTEFNDLVAQVNKTVDPHEKIQFAVVVNDEWTIDNGFLTPTMKIKRNVIEARYAEQEDAWYAARQQIIWQ